MYTLLLVCVIQDLHIRLLKMLVFCLTFSFILTSVSFVYSEEKIERERKKNGGEEFADAFLMYNRHDTKTQPRAINAIQSHFPQFWSLSSSPSFTSYIFLIS